MTEGLVSIITPIYNSGRYISRAIESVLSQTYRNWEMIITDDCSTDDGPEIVESYAKSDSRIKLFRLDHNGGPGKARNNSIMQSQGQYIAFLDSDDCWFPEKLERQLALMAEKKCAIVYSSYYFCDEENEIKGIVKCKERVRYWRMVCDNAIGFLTLMYDRKVTGDELMPTIRKRQDWGLNIRLLKKCKVAYGIIDPLAVYKIRYNSVSRDKLGLIKYNIAIYRDVVNMPMPLSVLMFIFVFIPFYVGRKFLNLLKNITFRKPKEIPELKFSKV